MKESIYRNRNSKQVAYFPRSRAYIHNPGMGIVSMLYSDHMVDMHIPELNRLGGAAFDRAAAETKKPTLIEFIIDRELDILPMVPGGKSVEEPMLSI